MVKSLEEMVAKGTRKLNAKAPLIAGNWSAAKGVMTSEYNNLPFGPKTKAAYAAGISNAVHPGVDVEKWARKFRAGVSQ